MLEEEEEEEEEEEGDFLVLFYLIFSTEYLLEFAFFLVFSWFIS